MTHTIQHFYKPDNRMIRMMLKPTGSTCYDETGFTFPTREEVNLDALITERGGISVCWMLLYGLTNVPPVLTWLAEERTDFGAQRGDGKHILDSRWCWEHGVIERTWQ